jgi:hypothetical protein
MCNNVLSHCSTFPAETSHPEGTAEDISFFKWKLEALETSQRLINKAAKTDNENAIQVSYRVSYRTALAA